jgi:hypothetical protein
MYSRGLEVLDNNVHFTIPAKMQLARRSSLQKADGSFLQASLLAQWYNPVQLVIIQAME